jgi:hypothetical protein
MYIWRIELLKSELRSGPLPASRLLPYLVGLGILMAVIGQMPLFLPALDPNQWDVVNLVGTVLATIIGLVAAYRSNGGQNGSDFAARLLALAWVLGWRLIPVLLLLMLGGMIIEPSPATGDRAPTTAAVAIATLGYQTLYYWRLCAHLSDISIGRSESPDSSSGSVAA